MATTKKSSKKPVVKRASSKASSATKITRRSAPKEVVMQSFRRAKASDFFTFRITKQTLYWGILCAIVFGLGVWVLSISVQVNNIYDQIDATNRTIDELK